MTTQRFDDIVCPFCGCLCDDLALTVEAGQIAQAENACGLALAGYTAFAYPQQPPAHIAGRPAALEAALAAAAQLLLEARFPLIYGLSDITCEAQRQAVALADLLGATLDPAGAATQGATALAFQQGGGQGATLGEIKNSADLVIYWGADPAVTHPRHLTRYSATPRGRQVPNGRRDRTLILLDHAPTATAASVDLFLQTQPGRDFECLWTLRALLRGLPADAAQAGLPRVALTDLLARMQRCRYGVIFYGPRLTQGRAGAHTVAALQALVAELNAHTHFVAQGMGGHGNAAGAENVLAWQTGYPQAVNFSRGYPRANPGEFSAADLLARGEADAALIIATDPSAGLPPAAVERLRQLPTVVIGPHAAAAPWASVAITTASAGVQTGGTAFRVDEVPLTLRPVLPAPDPNAEAVLLALHACLQPLWADRSAAWPARKAALRGGQGG